MKNMKNEILFDKIGFVDDALIEEAATYVGRPQAKKSRFRFNYVYSSLAAMCAVMLVLTGVLIYVYNTQPDDPVIDEISRGNSTGNSVNHGTAAFYEDWIYYFNETDSRHLYRIRNDSTEKTLISDQISGAGINVMDGWIYYLGYEKTEDYVDVAGDISWFPAMDYLGIFKCRLDGSDITLLSTDGARNLSVVGEWIYYIKDAYGNQVVTESDYIYKMRLDGSDKTQLTNEISQHMNVVGDWIYYTEHYIGDRHFSGDSIYDAQTFPGPHLTGIYKIRTDGTERTAIERFYLDFDDISNMVVSGEWIYYYMSQYINEQRYEWFYRVRTDGSDKVLLREGYFSSFTVEDEWVYFFDGVTIGKMRIDGSDEVVLSEYNNMFGSPNIVGDWIYFRNGGLYNMYATWRININGGEPELVTDLALNIGDVIELGGYNWRVIDVGLDLALIITEDVIDNRPYHSSGGSVTWENSEIREYLNGEFYENTFTDAEKMLIYETMNINAAHPEQGGLSGGNDTIDKIFLLAIQEVENYFNYEEARIALAFDDEPSLWWLRSRGDAESNASFVNSDGYISTNGISIDNLGIRPAMWVDKYFGENKEESVTMPSQSYLGTWYTEDNPPDDLTITFIDDNKIEFSLSVFRTVGTNGTAKIEGSQIIFNTDAGIRGTMQFYKGGVFMTVTESDFTYISTEATWYFTLREYEVVNPTPVSFSLAGSELTFTAESKVRDFRYLSIGGYVYEGEVRYLIREVLHSFDEFTPDNPIVISRIDLGSAFAAQGFSYMEDSGITRFFTLHGAMANWDPPVHAAEVGYMHFAFPETFEYLGETYSIQDADDIYYYDGRIGDVTFDSFGYIRTADGAMKVTPGQEIDGLVITRADATFAVDYNGELLLTDTDVILEGNIELTGRLYKVTNSIAEPSGFHITEVQAPSGIIPFGTGSFDTDYSQFFVWGDYDPEDEFPNIFAEADYAEVRATFSSVRLRVTSRSTGGNYIELTGITEIIN